VSCTLVRLAPKSASVEVEEVMRMLRSLCAPAVVCAAIVATGQTPALGAFPGENGRIAFSSDRRGGDFDIWTMNPDGSGLVNLTANSGADDFAPNWRADGRKIAFNSDRVSATNPEGDHEIFVMNADGSEKTQITFNAFDDEDPSWSPDGRRIAFQRDFDPVRGQVDYDLFAMRADGSRERQLTHTPGVQDWQNAWSPDGQRIAFLSDRDGDVEVFTMEPGGSDVRQLTFNDASEFVPNWSPDGEAIVFTSDRDGNFEIYTTSPDGSDQTRLTFNDAGDGYPAWSPDDNEIVFASDRAGVLGDTDLFTMRADGADQVQRTRFPGLDVHPDWQPLP
jgi:Tol biopolymer transport system component